MRPFGHLAFVLLAFLVGPFSSAIAATRPPQSEPRLVRLSYVQGDVRFDHGDGKQPDLRKPWKQAGVNLPIEQNLALATGDDGRAEIEFENGSVIYVAENSVILFEQLTMKDGVPATRLELVSGTVTIGLDSVPRELFAIDTPTGQLQIKYPESSFIRLDSYLDGMAFTPQADTGWDFALNSGSKVHVAKGQTLTYETGQPVRLEGAGQSKAPNDWDQWADARFQTRTTAMQAALKASGLTSPLPGLTDLYANGTFSSCAPYGVCWEPSQQAMAPSQAPQQRATGQASGQTAGKPLTPTPVIFRRLVSECPFPLWYPTTVLATTPEEFTALSEQANWQLHQPWSWAVCHYANWIYRDNRYRVVVRKRRRHHPVHWVKVGKKTGFVPAHPADQKDKPPVNLKHGIFTVTSAAGGERIERIEFNPRERVETLSSAPKEFRAAAHPEGAKAEPPKIEGRLLADATPNAKSTDTKRNESRITYDYGKGTFIRSGVEMGGRTTKSVVVGSLNSRGSFSGSPAGGASGRPGEGGYRGGGASGNSGRESSAGRSSGSGAEATARGGAGNISSGGGSSSGGEGRPK